MKKQNDFQKAKDILKGVEQAERFGEREKKRKCDYKDKRDVGLTKKEEGLRKRVELLDSIVPNRVCPSCRNRIWSDRSWVIEKRIAVCRSCYYSKIGLVEDGKVKGGFVKQIIVRVEIDGWEILKLRGRSGVGIKAFADRMGYSKAYQYQIENGGLRSMRIETVERMVKVFEDIGVTVTDSI